MSNLLETKNLVMDYLSGSILLTDSEGDWVTKDREQKIYKKIAAYHQFISEGRPDMRRKQFLADKFGNPRAKRYCVFQLKDGALFTVGAFMKDKSTTPRLWIELIPSPEYRGIGKNSLKLAYRVLERGLGKNNTQRILPSLKVTRIDLAVDVPGMDMGDYQFAASYSRTGGVEHIDGIVSWRRIGARRSNWHCVIYDWAQRHKRKTGINHRPFTRIEFRCKPLRDITKLKKYDPGFERLSILEVDASLELISALGSRFAYDLGDKGLQGVLDLLKAEDKNAYRRLIYRLKKPHMQVLDAQKLTASWHKIVDRLSDFVDGYSREFVIEIPD